MLLSTYTVTTTADDGPGSLRQAILDANASPGADAVHFAIPGDAGTVHTIRPLSPFPVITGPTTVDAATQSGYAEAPLIELDGSAAGNTDGLTIADRPSAVRGFAINRFSGNGVVAAAPSTTSARASERVIVRANHIGTDPSGTIALPNGSAGIRVVATFTRAQFNLISGNRGPGVHVSGEAPQLADAWLESNRIGTDRTGTLAIGNAAEGVLIENFTSRAFFYENVISGNGASGVRVHRVSGNVFMATNKVGTDLAGSSAIPNGNSPDALYRDGVTITNSSSVSTGSNNVISGNRGAGVAAMDSLVTVTGNNRIGTDLAGMVALPNGGDGVRFLRATPSSVVSGALISGNGGDGIRIEASERVNLPANRIGMNATRTASLGNAGNGITLLGCRFIEIGMRPVPPFDGFWSPPTPNRIGGNGGHGIAIHDGLAAGVMSGIVVFGSEIGYDKTTRVSLPNGGSGIHVASARDVTIAPVAAGTTGNTIRGNAGDGITVTDSAPTQSLDLRIAANSIEENGGSGIHVAGARGVMIAPIDANGQGNTISRNRGDGVTVTDHAGTPAVDVRVTGNSIHDNGGLGIDLRPAPGVTPNDERDLDAGANNLQNFPTITGVERAGESTAVRFRLKIPTRGFRVELFANSSRDPSGHGEGERFLGAVNVTTGPAGDVTGTITVASSAIGSRSWLTMTATDTFGNSSEFSPAVSAAGPRPAYRPTYRPRVSAGAARPFHDLLFEPAPRDGPAPRGLLA